MTNGNERPIWVVRIFANPASCLRLASSFLKECQEDWITGHPWLGMELLFRLEAEG